MAFEKGNDNNTPKIVFVSLDKYVRIKRCGDSFGPCSSRWFEPVGDGRLWLHLTSSPNGPFWPIKPLDDVQQTYYVDSRPECGCWRIWEKQGVSECSVESMTVVSGSLICTCQLELESWFLQVHPRCLCEAISVSYLHMWVYHCLHVCAWGKGQ